jgi:hypothetical protein
MVSLWKDKESRNVDKNFLGTGTFVAPRCILTVKHIAAKHRELFAIIHGETLASNISHTELHPELDIALVFLADHPPGVEIAGIDDASFALGDFIQMGGYFSGRYEYPSEAVVKQFSDDDRHWLVDQKQPVGYSGSPVVVGRKVKGVVCRHYDDKNIHRGCFIAVNQFIDWLNPHIGKTSAPITDIGEPTIDADALERIHKQARSEIKRALSVKLLSLFDELECDENGVPRAIREALEHDADTVGEESVSAVLQIVKDMRSAIEDDQVQLTPTAKKTIQKQIKQGLGWATRLCVGKGGAHYASARNFVDMKIPLDRPAGATMVVGTPRYQSWKVEQRSGLAMLEDEHVIDASIEFGEGEDVKKGIAKLVAASFAVEGKFDGDVDKRFLNYLQGEARGAAKDGKERFVVITSQSDGALNSEIRQWLRSDLGIGCIELTGFEQERGLLTVMEGYLLNRIKTVLEELSKPEWS